MVSSSSGTRTREEDRKEKRKRVRQAKTHVYVFFWLHFLSSLFPPPSPLAMSHTFDNKNLPSFSDALQLAPPHIPLVLFCLLFSFSLLAWWGEVVSLLCQLQCPLPFSDHVVESARGHGLRPPNSSTRRGPVAFEVCSMHRRWNLGQPQGVNA